MSVLPSSPADLLTLFHRSFADNTLSAEEARHLRAQLAAHGPHGQALEEFRHQLFAVVRERFNTLPDKAAIEWLEAANALLLPPAEDVSPQSEVYFSPDDDCVGAIQRFIKEAEQRLDVCVFTVSDDRITDELLAAHQRGVQLRLLTDNDKLFDRGSDVRQLHAAGVAIHVDNTTDHMHHKFAVADGRAVLTGSYNWTRSASLYNHENLLITEDSNIVRRYQAEFERLWSSLGAFQGQ
ncbi:phospholipase D-like domain-containing protein [Hymenobacter sp. DG25B]|jgi:phosphatidylserine/phosphatidylglycerophosphate/cardiolipin synthase-like enzyme|uniref:phospholipase D-like domain-containing protein n=1 Tax=Hymenobacter sp. DG25B TaxID=1385664 RepID=UPI0005C9D95A|nr:phospholipase D-like domain-containing protein [Hymenobacter sp. DG25B]